MTEEFSDIPLFMEQMAESIRKTTAGLDKAQTSAFFQRMLAAQRVYVAGAGRSGLIARAFAMRLLHLGFDVYVVGETVTPALQPGDTLVVFSGSGETHYDGNIQQDGKGPRGDGLPHHRIAGLDDEQDCRLRGEPRGPDRVLPG